MSRNNKKPGHGWSGQRRKVSALDSTLGRSVHREPCGNVSCRKCYVREDRFRDGALHRGVYPRNGQAHYPGKVIGGERFRSEEAAQAAGVNWHG